MSYYTKTESESGPILTADQCEQLRKAIWNQIRSENSLTTVADIVRAAHEKFGERPDRSRISQLINGEGWESTGEKTALCIKALGLFGVTPEFRGQATAEIIERAA